MCKLLSVSTSGYYKWLPRPLSKRDISNLVLDEKIKIIYEEHKGLYGYRRVYHALTIPASMNRVRKRMIVLGLYAVTKKKYKTSY
jgi:putative transposase